jgi:CDP-4-dehydro-6-deoxyglucose reductase, E1
MTDDIKYHLAEDTIDQQDVDALVGWLKGYPRLTKDRLTLEFEKRWGRWLGAPHSVFCNSGSSANLLMYYALLLSGKLKNKKVIVPSVGWVTSVAPAIQFGFEPVMCEADADTFGLELNHLEDLLKKHRPSSVFLVQVLGVPHKMKEVMALKERYGFFLMEDACAAIGGALDGKKLGAFGDMGSFSFYFGHQMSTIEGGMVSTADAPLRDMLLMLRSHGWSKDLDRDVHGRLVAEHGVDDFHSPFVFYEPGFNVRSTDLNAFLGIRQVEKLDWIVSRRRENQELFMTHLGGRLTPRSAASTSARWPRTPPSAGGSCRRCATTGSRRGSSPPATSACIPSGTSATARPASLWPTACTTPASSCPTTPRSSRRTWTSSPASS